MRRARAHHPLAVGGHRIARACLHEVLPIAATDVVQRAREGAGHNPMFERPEAFNGALLAFLAGNPVGE
jgi:pimeloyl-ACP methyl ester carboxylesterase